MNEMRKLMETVETLSEGNLRDLQEQLLDILEGIEDRTELDRVVVELVQALPRKQLMDMIELWGPEDDEGLEDWDDTIDGPSDGIPW